MSFAAACTVSGSWARPETRFSSYRTNESASTTACWRSLPYRFDGRSESEWGKWSNLVSPDYLGMFYLWCAWCGCRKRNVLIRWYLVNIAKLLSPLRKFKSMSCSVGVGPSSVTFVTKSFLSGCSKSIVNCIAMAPSTTVKQLSRPTGRMSVWEMKDVKSQEVRTQSSAMCHKLLCLLVAWMPAMEVSWNKRKFCHTKYSPIGTTSGAIPKQRRGQFGVNINSTGVDESLPCDHCHKSFAPHLLEEHQLLCDARLGTRHQQSNGKATGVLVF